MTEHRFGHFTVGTKDQHQIFYASRGHANATPWVLVHGNSGYTMDIDRMSAFDLSNERVITIHQRGVGNSLPSGNLDENMYRDLADDIEMVRHNLQADKINLLAWSGGASIAALYASQNPERVEKFVSYAPFFGTRDELNEMFATYPQRTNWQEFSNYYGGEKNTDKLVDLHIDRVLSNNPAISIEATQKYLRLSDKSGLSFFDFVQSKQMEEWARLTNNFRVHTNQMKSGYGLGPNEISRAFGQVAVQVPTTLVLPAEDSMLSGKMAQKIANDYPDLRMLRASGASHDIHDTQVQDYLSKVLHCSGCENRGACHSLNSFQFT